MTELPTPTYTWKLDITKETKRSGTNGNYYQSPIFKMHNMRWYLKFIPNWQNKQQVQLFVYILLPSNTSKILIRKDTQLLETNTIHTGDDPFDKEKTNWAWDTNPPTLKSEAIKNITRFTFVVKMTLLDVFDANGKDITEQYTDPTEQNLQAPLSINDDKYQEQEIRLNSLTTQMD
eukprot:465047_1